MLLSDLITKVAKQLVDTNHVRWTREELLDFLNMGLSTFIIKRPDVSRTTATQTATESLIDIPTDGYSIITVNHVNKRGVQYVDINKLGQLNPDWRLDDGVPVAWTRNEFDNDSVYIYPAPVTEVDVELVYSKDVQVESEDESFPLKEIYISILYDYIIYRAFNKDSASAEEAQKAQYHLMLFKDAIGDKAAADALKEQILQAKEVGR